jgi:uncharacterized paraquat-inducible protein A
VRGSSMVLAECPVCRASLKWTYLVRPIWSRWRCAQCGSLLAIDGRRRVLSILAFLPFLLVAVYFPPRWGIGDSFTPLLALAVWAPVFLALDRARALERRGLRCQGCGYDLRGQVAPRCPECGRQLDDQERAALAAGVPATTAQRARRGAWLLLAAAIMLFVATLLAVAITHYRGARVPTPTSRVVPAAATQAVSDGVGSSAGNPHE